MRLRTIVVLAATVACASAIARAQTDPLTLPLADLSTAAVAGTFEVPGDDGTGRMLSYGGAFGAMGVSVDGKYLYWACTTPEEGGNASGVAKLEIPPLGGVARVVEPCRGPRRADIAKIHPDPNAWRPLLGGVLEQPGRILVSGLIFYDAGGQTFASHWSGPTLSQFAGPYAGTDPSLASVGGLKTGYMKSYMGRVPQEWRAILGGDSYVTAGYISIISRASYGPGFTVFNAADVTRDAFPAKMLLGCPDAITSCRTWGTPTNLERYNGSEHWGGAFIVPGTRTLVAVERESVGPTCYGYATRNPADHGKPYPSPEGVVYCYSLADTLNEKGPMGYPYKLVGKLYDMADLVAVKRGQKTPWDIITPYAVVDLPGVGAGERFLDGGGAWNDVTGDYYLNRGAYPAANGRSVVSVYRGFGTGGTPPPPPPPTEICGDGIDNDGDGLVDEGCSPEICGDGIDNDGDGLVDEGCESQLVELCGDGIDNDHDGLVDEGCESAGAVPGTPTRLYGSVKRSTVSLKWHPPLTGGAVAEYVLEAGVSPGATVYSVPVGLSTALYVPNVGPGRYYVRVRGKNANGVGEPSNEVTLSVGCRTRPGKVSSLTATARGSLVTLTWTDPDGCSGTSYRISVGSATMSTDEPSTTAVLSRGSYLARVVPLSDTGVGDPAEVQFGVTGDTCAAPRFRTTLRAVVAGRRIGLFWSPLDPDTAADDDRLAPVSYALEAGTAPGASDIGLLPVGRASQFITDAPRGTYYVRARPVNVCGGGTVSNEVTLVVR